MINLVNFIKKNFIKSRFKKIGKNFVFHANSYFLTPENIEIGTNVYIGEEAHFSGEIIIKDNVMFGPRVNIIGGNHLFGVKGIKTRFLEPLPGENTSKIIINEDAWIGMLSIILSGIEIGSGAVIGAGSVVTKNIPPYTVAVGNPCIPIKKIFDDNTLEKHLNKLNYEAKKIKNIIDLRNNWLKKFKIDDELPIYDYSLEYKKRRNLI